LIKTDSKDIYNITKIFNQMLFFWSIYSSKNPAKKYCGFHKNIKQHNGFQHWY